MRFRRRMLLVSLGLFALVAFSFGERRMPTGPDGWGGRSRSPGATTPRDKTSPLTVATFNIHGCKGTDGLRDVNRVAKCVDGLDIVGLNEVRGAIWTNPQDQVTHLAGLCGLPRVNRAFAPSETRWFGAQRFGNGLLARHPLLAWQRIPLPRRYDDSCRNMLLAYVDCPEGTVAVLITHITRSEARERAIQLETVLGLFASLDRPAILLADLNTPPDDPRMERFLIESDAVDAIAEGGVAGNDRIDWILTRGLECLEAQRIDTGASDHPLFTARLAVSDDRERGSGVRVHGEQ